jgi:hypothetical protein
LLCISSLSRIPLIFHIVSCKFIMTPRPCLDLMREKHGWVYCFYNCVNFFHIWKYFKWNRQVLDWLLYMGNVNLCMCYMESILTFRTGFQICPDFRIMGFIKKEWGDLLTSKTPDNAKTCGTWKCWLFNSLPYFSCIWTQWARYV